MNILFISPQPVWGGAATANITIAKILKDNGVNILYNDEYYNGDTYDGLEIYHYQIHGKTFKSNQQLISLVSKLEIDAIIWGVGMVQIYYRTAIKRFYSSNVRQILLLHSLTINSFIKQKIFDYAISSCARFMNKIVFVSEYTQNQWNRYNGMVKVKDRQMVIYNSVQKKNYKKRTLNKEKNIGFVGRLSEEKQPELFCSLSTMSQYNYLVFGDGPLMNSLKNRFPNVMFRGMVSNQDDIYNNIDVLIVTSKFENCPMVILESKIRGIPCVAPRVGGCPEIIDNNNDGILFESNEPMEIIDNIERILTHYELFSEKCICNAEAFTDREISKRWIKLLKDL